MQIPVSTSQAGNIVGEDGSGPRVCQVGRQGLKGGLASGDGLDSEASKCKHGQAGILDLLDLESSKVSLLKGYG